MDLAQRWDGNAKAFPESWVSQTALNREVGQVCIGARDRTAQNGCYGSIKKDARAVLGVIGVVEPEDLAVGLLLGQFVGLVPDKGLGNDVGSGNVLAGFSREKNQIGRKGLLRSTY